MPTLLDPAGPEEEDTAALDPPAELEAPTVEVPAVEVPEAARLEDGGDAEDEPPTLLATLALEDARELLPTTEEERWDEDPAAEEDPAADVELPPPTEEEPEEDEDVDPEEEESPSPVVEQPASTKSTAPNNRPGPWFMTPSLPKGEDSQG